MPPTQQNPDDAKFAALLQQHNYTPPAQNSASWYDKLKTPAAPAKPDPLSSVHVGGDRSVPQNYKEQTSQAFDQAKEQTDQAASKFFTDKGIVNKGEDLLHATSGAASQLTAPLTPIFRPLSEMIGDIGNKIGENKAVQDFAQTPAGQTTARVAGDVADTANIVNTVAGAKGAVDSLPKVYDKAVEVGQKVDQAYAAGANKVKETIAPDINHADIVDNYYKAIKPTVGGKTTLGERQAYDKNIVDGILSIRDNKENLTFLDKNGEEIKGQTPSTVNEMSHGLDQTQKSIFSKYDALAKKTGSAGAQIDTAPVASELDKVITNEALQISHPEAVKYAQDMKSRLAEGKLPDGSPMGSKKLTPEVVQTLIKNYNTALDAFMQHPSYDNASKAAIDAGIVQNFRDQLDKTIQSATGEDYGALKRQYGALTALRKDVNKRATVIARQNGGGLADYAQVFSGGDMVHGILSLNPALFAKGAAQAGLTKLFQHLKSPDRAIQNMFKAAEPSPIRTAVADSISTEPSVGLATKKVNDTNFSTSPETVAKNIDEVDYAKIQDYIKNPKDVNAYTKAQPMIRAMGIDKLSEADKTRFLQEVLDNTELVQGREKSGVFNNKKVPASRSSGSKE